MKCQGSHSVLPSWLEAEDRRKNCKSLTGNPPKGWESGGKLRICYLEMFGNFYDFNDFTDLTDRQIEQLAPCALRSALK